MPVSTPEPATSGEALQQREDLAIVWLHHDGDQLVQPALDWLHARGWQRHPWPLCPDDHR